MLDATKQTIPLLIQLTAARMRSLWLTADMQDNDYAAQQRY